MYPINLSILEMTGNRNKIKAFLSLIEPYGMIEMARTGGVALKKRLTLEYNLITNLTH